MLKTLEHARSTLFGLQAETSKNEVPAPAPAPQAGKDDGDPGQDA